MNQHSPIPNQTATRAVIYCRVSGSKQVREGDGLASQERRCREYAAHHKYDVVEVFHDDISGKSLERPAMTAMLAYLRKHKSQRQHVVVIDDISRFARGL
jgi:DNA invertase Pin-like site-specific DNA recombinase